MTVEALIKEATAIQHQALAVPLVPFTMWAKFRAQGMAHAKGFTLVWRGVKLRSAAHLPKWLQRSEYLLSGVGRIYPERSHFYDHVILSCDERSEDRAVDRMMDALQLMLGLPQLSRWKLAHIARLRNDYVHAGSSGDDLHDLCQFLRELLARHINYWIFCGHDLPDHNALLQIAKLPGDKAQLEQLRAMIDRRLSYFRDAPPPSAGAD